MMTTQTQTTDTNAVVGRLFNAANAAYEAWKQAPIEKKVTAWQQWEDAEAAYWRALHTSREGKET